MCAIFPVRRGGCPPKDTENRRRDPSRRPWTVGKAVGESWGAEHRPHVTDREEASCGGARLYTTEGPEGLQRGAESEQGGAGVRPLVRAGRGRVEPALTGLLRTALGPSNRPGDSSGH